MLFLSTSDPVFPERTQWIPRINPEGVNGLIFYNNKEDKTASEPHLIKVGIGSLRFGCMQLGPTIVNERTDIYICGRQISFRISNAWIWILCTRGMCF